MGRRPSSDSMLEGDGSRNRHNWDKWHFCLTSAQLPGNRRDHDETTAPDPQPGFQV